MILAAHKGKLTPILSMAEGRRITRGETMLVDVYLAGRVERCLIDRNWHGCLEVVFATFGKEFVVKIESLDTNNVWENVKWEKTLGKSI